MTSEILPCPFCGGDIINSRHIRDGRSMGCGGCSASVHAYEPDAEAKAVSRWNTRAAEALAIPRGAEWNAAIDTAASVAEATYDNSVKMVPPLSKKIAMYIRALALSSATHHHCAAGCEKSVAELRCAKCGGAWVECKPEECVG